MEEEERQRQKIQRLQLNMDQMREVVRREAEDQAGHKGRRLASGEGAGEHVHRERGGDKRSDQQNVVTENQVVRDYVHGPERHRLKEKVIGVGKRQGAGEKIPALKTRPVSSHPG